MIGSSLITEHALTDRRSRLEFCKELDEGATIVKEYFWDKGHVNGPEIHKISSNAIIWIYNARTKKLVTALIARPGQIQRYFDNNAPQYLIDKAIEYQREGYNHL